MEFKTLLTMTQNELLEFLPKYLRNYGYTVEVTDFAIGATHKEYKDKPTLVAHLDTINTHKVFEGTRDMIAPDEEDIVETEDYIMLSPEANPTLSCLGADDRVGVKTILDIIRVGLRPNILFTTDEEIGCVGTGKLIDYMDGNSENTGFEWLHSTCMFIQIDRGVHEGSWNEMVFYGYDYQSINSIYDKLCENYTLAEGSFTDVAELAPFFNAPCVNLSASYMYEHTRKEFINLSQYRKNLNSLFEFLLWMNFQDTESWVYTDVYTLSEHDYLTESCGRYLSVEDYAETIYTGVDNAVNYINSYIDNLNYKDSLDVFQNLDDAYYDGITVSSLNELESILNGSHYLGID